MVRFPQQVPLDRYPMTSHRSWGGTCAFHPKSVFKGGNRGYQAAPKTSTLDLRPDRLCKERTLRGAAPGLAQALGILITAFSLESETP